MKKWLHYARNGITLLLAGILWCAGCPLPADAVAHEASVYGDKNIVQTEAEGGRQFRMNYRVWSDERVNRTAEPSKILFLLDNTAGLGCLSEAPEDPVCYRSGISYADKIGEKTVLYTEIEGSYFPVALSGGAWKTAAGETVGERRGKTDRFTADLCEKGSSLTRLEQVQKALRGFLEKLAEVSPESEVGFYFFGGEEIASLPVKTVGEHLAEMLAEVSTCEIQASEVRSYASALERAAKEAEGQKKDKPLYLVSLACGDRDREDDGLVDGVRKSQRAIQRIREAGGKTYSILLSNRAGEQAEEFWSSMSSAPLDTHFHVCAPGEKTGCLDRVLLNISSAFPVSVVQNLDSRFTVSAEERLRLRQNGAEVLKNRDGSWSVLWDVELPRSAEAPWTAGLTAEAQTDFPGGNEIPLDGEGSGLYKSGKKIADFPQSSANVPVPLTMRDVEESIFLGEAVKVRTGEAGLEEAMLRERTPNWYGKGQTGTFSYLWEDENGTAVGSLEQLAGARSREDRVYRFRVTFRPAARGIGAAGEPVTELQASACCRVRVAEGTVKVKVAGAGLSREDSVLFRLEGGGMTLYREARAESDPETGTILLETEFTGLPFGAYTATPQSPALLREEQQVCLVGICAENDTIDTGRNLCEARFSVEENLAAGALRAGSASESFLPALTEDGETP